MTKLFYLALLIVLSGCSSIRSAELFVPEWFGFKKIQAGVFVDNEMSPGLQLEFLESLDKAKAKISGVFGSITSNPSVFSCSTETCFVSHGGVSAKGKSFGDSMLLLSPRGIDDVIISHELTHVELHHRVGVWRSMSSIPTWFDEGLAVLVSQDPRYSEQAWLNATENGLKAPRLEDVGKLLNDANWQIGYGTARREVGQWYQRAGSNGLKQLIKQVSDGNDFMATFQSVARLRDSETNSCC